MKKSEAEALERAVRSLSKHKYWDFINWLASGGEGPLWDCLRPFRRPPEIESSKTNGASNPPEAA